jgi:hypothetical protein
VKEGVHSNPFDIWIVVQKAIIDIGGRKSGIEYVC